MDAARPFARAVLDISLPGDEVLEDVGALIRNLIAMNEILRDHEHVSIRLVMNPDRMVVDEARRTFTYLNLYGFLTDAVVVNRVFGEEVGDYFGAWRERQQEHLADGASTSFAPVPGAAGAVVRARRSSGRAMLDRLGDARVRRARPRRACCTTRSPSGSSWAATARRWTVDAAARRARRDQPQEDRPRARRAGQRPQAHGAPAARARRLQSGRRGVRGRRAGGSLPWPIPRLKIPSTQLRARIRSTADAAERLSFEAAARATAGDEQDAGRRARAADDATHEAQALVALVQLLRDLLPDELRRQVTDLIRQVLMLVRAVIDWYLAAPRARPAPARAAAAPVVEDIPLDDAR